MKRVRRRRWTIGILVAVVVVGLALVALTARAARRPRAGSVVEVSIKGEIPEEIPGGAFGRILGAKKLTMRDYVEGILKARDDRRVNGLLVTIDRPTIGLGKAQELRDALSEFRRSGKWTVAWMETAGEFAPGNLPYYLATACQSIWIAPSGDVNLTGLRFEVPFIRGSLDKLGIVPDFDHIGRYKTFKNFFTDHAMDRAYRESMEAIVESLYRQVRRGIAEGRGVSEEQVGALIDRGPFLGPQALEAKLVDRLGYRDELEADLKEKNGGRLPLVKLASYLGGGRHFDHGVKVALIYGNGAVTRGESDFDPLLQGATMGSDTVAAAIRKAREDRSIKAIVFRVDSPGGSYVASDIIWREVSRTHGVKPIVISMSDLAGSGGYFVAMAADRIIAQPATLTASIGVLGGKFVTRGFFEKIGVTSDAVQRGRHATYFSTHQPYTPEERAIFEGALQRIYRDFVEKAAKGRGRTFDQIDAIAKGRVWTGEDALRLGLVDELGGITLAIRRALDLAKLDPESSVRLVLFPEPKGLLLSLLSRDDTRAALDTLRQRVTQVLEEGTIPAPAGVLLMPFVPRPE